jgi:hypothetical protein
VGVAESAGGSGQWAPVQVRRYAYDMNGGAFQKISRSFS